MEIYLDFKRLADLERQHKDDAIFLDTLNTFIDTFMDQGSFTVPDAFIKSKDYFIFRSLEKIGVIKSINGNNNIDDENKMLKS